MHFRDNHRSTAAASLVAAAIFCCAASAQVTTAIHGIVKDTSGAMVPKAAVKLVDTSTKVTQDTTSTNDGSFVFTNLPAGSFNITVTAPGFQATTLDNVVVDSGRTTDVAILLNVGATTESVEVKAAGTQLETTSNEIGNTINVKAINDLPYTSRDALNFSLLTAGATTTSGYSTFNGLPNASMDITLDGMSNTSQRFKIGGTSFYTFAPQRLDA